MSKRLHCAAFSKTKTMVPQYLSLVSFKTGVRKFINSDEVVWIDVLDKTF